MKKIFLLTVAIVLAEIVSAETITELRIMQSGAVTYSIDINGIDSILFVEMVTNPNFHARAFTINADGDQVFFSQGNLQYQASTNLWRFAENQYDAIGEANSAISSTNDGWIDLFGWGTSGYDNTASDPFAINYQPWSTSKNSVGGSYTIKGTEIESINCDMKPITGKCDTTWVGGGTYNGDDVNQYGYGPSTFMTDKNLTGTSANYDWGVFNAISNGGNQAGIWRTLTRNEWNYILTGRNLAQYLCSQATVCGVHGYVLLPDDFTLPDGLTWSYQTNDWDTNTYGPQAWSAMEATGAIFLPAAGNRNGTNVNDVGSKGYYCSASYYDQYYAYCMSFDSSGVHVSSRNRYSGRSVRLVRIVSE